MVIVERAAGLARRHFTVANTEILKAQQRAEGSVARFEPFAFRPMVEIEGLRIDDRFSRFRHVYLPDAVHFAISIHGPFLSVSRDRGNVNRQASKLINVTLLMPRFCNPMTVAAAAERAVPQHGPRRVAREADRVE
ncbi:hypothetical protein D9M70_546190 [compost metagenome]